MTAAAAYEDNDSLWVQKMAGVTERRERAWENYRRLIQQAELGLTTALARLDEERETLAGMRESRQVLVRTTVGAPQRKYHSNTRPCGRVTGKGRDRSSFKAVLEGEAGAQGLTACGACL